MTFASRRQFFAYALSAALPSFAAGPKRNMIIRSARPEDLEMPMDGFATWITPVERFFVRSHHYTPKVELADWRLEVDGEVATPLRLSIDDLKKMPQIELAAVLECAGNGRSLYEPPVIGLQWEYGGVGNGRCAGVRLADVLKKAQVKESAKEVLFDGADVPVGTMPDFQRTIPLAKAMHPDTLLAYDMNGEPLTASHGFPLRLVVPGWAGDSWVKWIRGIRVLDKEFDGFFMKTAYRRPSQPVAPGSTVDPAAMEPVTSMHIKSVIASPSDGAHVTRGPVRISGAAWSGETPVAGVDVSVDAGRTWRPARLSGEKSQYGWRLWEYAWTPPRNGYFTLMARARDLRGETQPFVQEWNPSGYLHNVVHQINVNIGGGTPNAGPGVALPPFDYPAMLRSACLTCHEADVIEQQRLTRSQWDREVDKMIRWGAVVEPRDRAGIIDFLTSRFGPRPRR